MTSLADQTVLVTGAKALADDRTREVRAHLSEPSHERLQ